MLVADNQKQFPLPKPGVYVGVVADVIDLGIKQTAFGPKAKIAVVWLLNAKDETGEQYQVASIVSATMNEKSALHKVVKGILGQAPPVPYETENLLGRANQLFIEHNPSQDGKKMYANVSAILPLDGKEAIPVPATFVRYKDKPARNYPNRAPQQASGGAPAAPSVNLNTPEQQAAQAVPAAEEDVAF